MDKEKLIAEIERLKQTPTPFCSDKEQSWDDGYNEALDDILRTIYSLPEGGTESKEKVYQASEDLEKELERREFEIGKYMTTNLLKKRNHQTGIFHLTQKDYAIIAQHFAQWGAQWQKEQDIKLIQRTKDSWYKEGFIKGQIEGLSDDEKYQQGRFDEREQMMKGAEPAEIGYFNQNGLSILPGRSIKRMNFEEGDKVRIIVVKED